MTLPKKTRPVRALIAASILLFGFFLSLGTAEGRRTGKTSPYLYEDTRRLVDLVEDAASLMEVRGKGAFKDFAVKGSRWFTRDYYLFVYDLNGTCVFHPMTPELVGRNLMGFADMNGKPAVRLLTDIGRKPARDASGWVFYLWAEGTRITPLWKSSYARKVVVPDGKIYVVGCGSYRLKVEKVFIQERVDAAAELIMTKGLKPLLDDLRKPASPFHYLGTYLFVMDIHGRTVVDPAFPTLGGRDLTGQEDAIGRHVVMEMLEKLKDNDRAWVQYLSRRPGASLPSRKLAYVRKVKVGDEVFVVGSDFYLASPIWMRL